MRLKTPDFWYSKELTWPAALLFPLSGLYYAGRLLHKSLQIPETPSVPTICVGNIVAGGGGKTPVALTILDILKGHFNIHETGFLTRGYGGCIRGPEMVEPEHTSKDVGDEAILLSRHAQTIVSKNRLAGAEYALNSDIPLLIMDDGLQNRSMSADIKILVIQSKDFMGNGCLIPAGPLRELPSDCLHDIDGIVLVGDGGAAVAKKLPTYIPQFQANIHTESTLQAADTPVIAFSGIARPERFFNTVRDMDFEVLDTVAFPDHHDFTDEELRNLRKNADDKGAVLITTEKDYVRLPPEYRSIVSVVKIHIMFADEPKFITFLTRHLYEKTALLS